MFAVKWVSILAFFVMVGAGISHYAGEVSRASLICYIAAGVFICGIFYSTTLHKIFPKSNIGDRVADILEKTVEGRQVALMHHIQHAHQGDLATMRQLQSPRQDDAYEVPGEHCREVKTRIVDSEVRANKWNMLMQRKG